MPSKPPREFFVLWDVVTQSDVNGLSDRLNSAVHERDMQSYLELHPLMLIQHLGGGHGRWVIPQKRLGAEHVTDFVIGEKSSIGYEWVAVEIESPSAPLFTKGGDVSHTLNHAIRQIKDWRIWLRSNQNYAARAVEDQGLGLTDVGPEIPGLIIIGRESMVDPNANALRRQIKIDDRIEVHTYDWLVRQAQGRVDALAQSRLALLRDEL